MSAVSVCVSSLSMRQQSQCASVVSVFVSSLIVHQQSQRASAVSVCVSSLSARQSSQCASAALVCVHSLSVRQGVSSLRVCTSEENKSSAVRKVRYYLSHLLAHFLLKSVGDKDK